VVYLFNQNKGINSHVNLKRFFRIDTFYKPTAIIIIIILKCEDESKTHSHFMLQQVFQKRMTNLLEKNSHI